MALEANQAADRTQTQEEILQPPLRESYAATGSFAGAGFPFIAPAATSTP